VLRPVLHAGIVVAFEPKFAPKLEVRNNAVPDQKLVVFEVILPFRLPRDAAILDRPQLRITFPAGKIFPVKQAHKPVFRPQRNDDQQHDQKGNSSQHDAILRNNPMGVFKQAHDRSRATSIRHQTSPSID
jgi:hypothetical protein